VSNGKINAIFARDKMQLTGRLSLEAGLRWERQTGTSDVGLSTVDVSTLAPRLSAAYDLAGDGNSLIIGSYGRYYQAIIQDFSDEFAQVAQQTNYDNYVWNGSTWVFANRVEVSGAGSGFVPNLDLRPAHMDEYTVGYQRQFGRNIGASARFISRTWNNLIDDVLTFTADADIDRRVENYEPAERTYRGLQLSAEKRFSDNWFAQASYTYSRTRGNHFGDTFTPLGDYLDAQCRTTTDLTIGANGTIACSEVQNGANKYGAPTYDRPHNFKLQGAYVRPIGPVNMTFGALTEALSKWRFQQERTLNVLLPGTTTNSGNTGLYYYNERGANQVEGTEWYLDTSVEGTWRIFSTAQAGFRAEIFNITNRQEKLRANNFTWCGSDANETCATARANFGTATSRGSFRGGLAGTFTRSYRFSAIIRF
jgi:hypothetical protein